MIIILTNAKLNKHLPLLIYILIFPLTVFLNGCYTTKMEILTEEQIPSQLSKQSENEIEIVSIRLNTGENISLKGKDARFLLDFQGMKNVIHYTISVDTVKKEDGKLKVVFRDTVVEVKDIKLAKIEISRLDGVKTALLILGIAALAVLVFYIVALIAVSAALGDIFKH